MENLSFGGFGGSRLMQDPLGYLESLNRIVKLILTMYLGLLSIGLLASIVEIEMAFVTIMESSLDIPLIMIAGGITIFWILYYGVERVQWLGDLHFWLDKQFFGFLGRANEAIFLTLLQSLDPTEWGVAKRLGAPNREEIAQSIFSALVRERRLFSTLHLSGLFRYWLWYWALNYGTFAFSMLTLCAFAVAIANPEPIMRDLVMGYWAAAMGHLLAAVGLGYWIVFMTKKVTTRLIKSHCAEIAAIFRQHVASRTGT